MSERLDEEKIIVMFPASKNFPVEEKTIAKKERDPLKEAKGPNLPKHVNLQKSPRASVRMSLDELIEVVDSQVELLKESNKRMKYYMDEIEFYLPTSQD